MPRPKFSEMLQDWPMKGRQGGKRAAPLEELRKSRSITQAKVAEYLGTNQGEVSRIERRTDIYISTLAEYIRALAIIGLYVDESPRRVLAHYLCRNLPPHCCV